MNDRHRTIERYNKKVAARHKRINEFLLNDLGKSVATALEAITYTFQQVIKALNEFTERIKEMPDMDFKKKLAELAPALTPEQLAALEKIRGDGSNERPNNESESVGE